MNEKKICLVSLNNLYLCPYIDKYINLLNCKVDIICWNRHGIIESKNVNQIYSMDYNMEENNSKFKKLLGYLKFRKYAKSIIEKEKYNGLILLQTIVAIVLKGTIDKSYFKKYIVDVRDYTLERNTIFYKIIKKIINKSYATVISSRGFEAFLPPYDYVMVHNDLTINYNVFSQEKEKDEIKGLKADKIIISYIGLIRFHEQNKKMILRFKNDNRFLMKFIGKGANDLIKFCEENDVNNVILIDQFSPEETLNFYRETDIIFNLYGSNTPLLDYALSNKLYYAANLKMPILVCSNTYMEEVSLKNGFGYVVDLDDKGANDKLYKYFKNIDWKKFEENCNVFLNKVKHDNEKFESEITNFQASL